MCRLDQVEHEQPAHPVVREALPHLDEEEEEEPCGMCEERHRRRSSATTDRPAWSRSFSEITERNLAILRESLEADAAGHFEPGDEEARKLGDFYATCMDEEKAETSSAEMLREQFATIEAITDHESLARAVAQLHLRDVTALFVFLAQQDLGAATQEI